MKIQAFYLMLVANLITYSMYAQDSLLLVADKKETPDTTKIKLYNQLSKKYENIDPELGLDYGLKALQIAQKIKDETGVAQSFNNIGNIYYVKSNFIKAREFHQKALAIRTKLNDRKGMAKSLNNIGLTYVSQGDYEKSLQYYMKSLKIKEEINDDPKSIAASFSNIGVLFEYQGANQKALEYHYKALKIRSELGDSSIIASSLHNIANVYVALGNNDEALKMYKRCLHIFEYLNDNMGLASILNNIGSIYEGQNKHSEALQNHRKALEIRYQIGDKAGIITSLINIGKNYEYNKEYNKAITQYINALKLAEEINDLFQARQVYFSLARTYELLNQYETSSKYLHKYIAVNDKMYGEELSKQIADMQVKYETEKKESQIVLLQKDKEVQAKDLERQKMLRNSILIGLVLVAFFLALLFNRLLIIRKQKRLIEDQHKLVSTKNSELDKQKSIVETKNHEITQSIQYAQRIQLALLPSEREFQKTFSNSFILFQPKDIVSGDYYWLSEKENYIFYAIADCTGHGVPGGFMSMLGTALLNEIIDELKVDDCGQVLTLMREKIMQALKQAGDSESKDGMDMVLIRLNKKTLEIHYSAANNSLYVVSSKQSAISKDYCVLQTADCQLFELPCDKMPVGVYHSEVKPFQTFNFQLSTGDIIYTYTDGYADQFGGEKGKKYTYKKLREKLLAISEEPVVKQKAVLENEFENWRGNNEQVDDVCLIGVRV